MNTENQAFQFDAQLSSLSAMKVCEYYKAVHGETLPFSCKALADFCGVNSSTASTAGTKAGVKFTRVTGNTSQATSNKPQAKTNNNDMMLFIDACVALQEIDYTDVPRTPILPGIDGEHDYNLDPDWRAFLQTNLDAAPLNKAFVAVFRNVPNSALVKVGLESPDMRQARMTAESLEQDKINQAILMLRGKGWKIIPAEACQDFANFEATRDYRTAEQQTMACQAMRENVSHTWKVETRLARMVTARLERERLEFAATQAHAVQTVQASVELDALAKQQELEQELELAKQQAINAQQAQLDMAGQLALLMKKMEELEANQSKPQGKPQGKVKGNGQAATM